MNHYVLSLIVNNEINVISRISGLLARKGYHVSCLSMREAEDPSLSRMTFVLQGDEHTLNQAKRQLCKLVDVITVVEMKIQTSIRRELALVKVKAGPTDRVFIGETAKFFRAKIVDVAEETLIVEITGDDGKISAFIKLMEPYGIVEVVRTGLAALERGNEVPNCYKEAHKKVQ